MTKTPDAIKGWTLQEAAQHLCPAEWTSWQCTKAEAERTGSRLGAYGRALNSGDHTASRSYERADYAKGVLIAALIERMRQAALVGVARLGSLVGERRQIEPDQWPALRNMDFERCIVSDRPKNGTVFYGVTVYPASHPLAVQGAGRVNRAAVRHYLEGVFRGSRQAKAKVKSELMHEFPNLSGREFDRIWADTAPENWTRPGRRK